MMKLQQQALDRALAAKLASDLLSKSSSELCAIFGSNPAVVRDWIGELARWREQSRQEAKLFDEVIEHLDAGQRLTVHQAAA